MYTTSLAEGSVIPPQIIVGGRIAQVLYFGGSRLSRLQPSELPRAERRCARGGDFTALDLSGPLE